MARKLGFYLVSVLVVLIVAAGSPVLAGTRSTFASACRSWVVKTSPNPGTGESNVLDGVAAVSANKAWAVGYYYAAGGSVTLIQHWNGTSWAVVPSPSPGTGGQLFGVYALSATDVWAVGRYSGGTLIEHWNGTSWAVVPSPTVGSALEAIRGTSSRNIWAVGYTTISEGSSHTLILHWGGSHWRVVSSPSIGTQENGLRAVRPLSPTDAWAVGYDLQGSADRSLILHWNGSRWRIVPSPNVGTNGNVLDGVRISSATDAWAVGYFDGSHVLQRTLILHWNGHHWRVSPSPYVRGGINDLYAIGGTSPSNAYAVGTTYRATSSKTLILHWDGSHWRIVPGASPGTGFNALGAVFALSSTNIWAAGNYDNGGESLTLVEHCR